MAGSKTKRSIPDQRPMEPSFERSIATISEAMQKISQTNENILEVQKVFNDNFIFHAQESKSQFNAICKGLDANVEALKAATGETTALRTDFNKWFYPLMSNILKKTVYTAMGVVGAAFGLKALGLW